MLLVIRQDIPLPKELDSYALSAEDILEQRHLMPDCPRADLALFKDVDFILLREGNNLYSRSIQMFAEAGFTPNIKMSISQMVTSYRLANNGLGAAFISDRLVASKRSNLKFFMLDSGHTERLFYFLQPKRDYTPFAVREFMDFAEKHIPSAEFIQH